MFASSEPTLAAGVAILVNCNHVRNIKSPPAPSSRTFFVDRMMEDAWLQPTHLQCDIPTMTCTNTMISLHGCWMMPQSRTIVLGSGDFNRQWNVGILGGCWADLARKKIQITTDDETYKQLEFGRVRVSSNYCNKGGAANADTKGRSRQNIQKRLREPHNLRIERIVTEFVQLSGVDHEPTKPNQKSDAEQPTPLKCAEYLQNALALEVPHQICSFPSGEVMKMPTLVSSRWMSLIVCCTRSKTGDAQTMIGFWLTC